MNILLFLLTLLPIHLSQAFTYPKQIPFPPFQIADNLYYVGTDDLASYLITTPKGNILINSALESNVPLIKASIEKLGFKFSDTKILLISHAHFDHAAGSKAMLAETKAQYYVMDADVPLITSGGKSDFVYGNDPDFYFPPTQVDKVLHDGDQVKLGNTVLTAHLTAGHTPGNTSWTLNVTEKGKIYQAVIVGSLSINTGYKLVNNKAYPSIAHDYAQSIQTLKALRGDIFLGSHTGYFDLKKKYALMNQSATNPFIDPQGYQQFISHAEQKFKAELKKQGNSA
jgi:metallo-beta-lactamase class B